MKPNILLTLLLAVICCSSCGVTKCRYSSGFRIEMPSLRKEAVQPSKSRIPSRKIRMASNAAPSGSEHVDKAAVAKDTSIAKPGLIKSPTTNAAKACKKPSGLSSIVKQVFSPPKQLAEKTQQPISVNEDAKEESSDTWAIIVLAGILLLGIIFLFIPALENVGIIIIAIYLIALLLLIDSILPF